LKPIYLDYNATTPIAPEVREAMLPFLGEQFGNPSSAHAYGRPAAEAIRAARVEVAALIGAAPEEIVFTGCATEANNLALFGTAAAAIAQRRHLIVSAIEHPAVLAPARELESRGWSLTVLPVDAEGRVDADDVAKALRPDTALVSVMHANNEIGSLQDIAAIARLAHECGALMHTDAAQSAGKVVLDVDALGVDLLTLAGHKFYAPKGVGALYVRRGLALRPALYGAGQEHGLRPGTENVAGIVALGAAARLARTRLPEATARLQSLRDRLHQRLRAAIADVLLNGHPTERLPNTLNLSFPKTSGRALLEAASERVAASVGSACHSAEDAVSGVLAAIGADASRAAGAVRLSVGYFTSENEIDIAAEALIGAWRSLSTPASQG
jgi:cysteine desulfurase